MSSLWGYATRPPLCPQPCLGTSAAALSAARQSHSCTSVPWTGHLVKVFTSHTYTYTRQGYGVLLIQCIRGFSFPSMPVNDCLTSIDCSLVCVLLVFLSPHHSCTSVPWAGQLAKVFTSHTYTDTQQGYGVLLIPWAGIGVGAGEGGGGQGDRSPTFRTGG